MRTNRLRTWGLIAVAAGSTFPSVTSAEPHGQFVPRTSVRVLRDAEPTPAIASSTSSVSAVQLPRPLDVSEIRRLITSGGVAGAPVGSTRVYGNEVDPITDVYGPDANQRMADDLRLANGPCDVVYYDLVVYGAG